MYSHPVHFTQGCIFVNGFLGHKRINIKHCTSTNLFYYTYEVNTMTDWEHSSVIWMLKLKRVCRPLLIITET